MTAPSAAGAWQAYRQWLLTEGSCVEAKPIGDGLYVAVKPLIFHWTMIVGQIGDTFGYNDRWCYETRDGAIQALRDWDGRGDPVGWHRHPATARRREGGNSERETVAS